MKILFWIIEKFTESFVSIFCSFSTIPKAMPVFSINKNHSEDVPCFNGVWDGVWDGVEYPKMWIAQCKSIKYTVGCIHSLYSLANGYVRLNNYCKCIGSFVSLTGKNRLLFVSDYSKNSILISWISISLTQRLMKFYVESLSKVNFIRISIFVVACNQLMKRKI